MVRNQDVEFNLSEQQYRDTDIDLALNDLEIEQIITGGILIILNDYTKTPELIDQTNEKLKADPNTQPAKNPKKITIHSDGIVTFCTNYIKIHKVSPELTIIHLCRRGHDAREIIESGQNINKIIGNGFDKDKKKIFDKYGVYFDLNDFTLKRLNK